VSRFLTAHQHNTVPFTLVDARKHSTEDKIKIQTVQKLNTTQKKQTTQNTAKQKTTLVYSLLTTLDQEKRWAYSYNAPEPSQG